MKATSATKSATVLAALPNCHVAQYRGIKRSLISALRNVPVHGAEYLYRFLDTGDVPVQVVLGRDDPVTPMPGEDVGRSVLSRADIRLLDGVGHLPHYERPDETASVVLDFLRAPMERA